MRITKFGHACVRISEGDHTLLVDPGIFAGPEVAEGVDAVLITHEHADHYSPDLVKAIDAPVFTIAAVAAKIATEAPEVAEMTTTVVPGERFTAAGFDVRAVNQKHAIIHAELPHFDNSGYLIEAGGMRVFHPGDALDGVGGEPAGALDVLFLPVSAPWAASRELIDFARRVGARTNIAIHDRVYSPAGSATFDQHAAALLPAELGYRRLADGEDL
ncbi:MAG: MBL fold metallo-hydrolase [Nocardioides sp.]|uniref:MBL fold metallo-hydrolase n=1 Tax=Nocardioides sp. TaxID=35761 RepID=UPI0039E5509D